MRHTTGHPRSQLITLALSWALAACLAPASGPAPESPAPGSSKSASAAPAAPSAHSAPTVAGPPSGATSSALVEAALVAGVDEARAVQRVRELVAFGPRMGGTPSGDRAAAYRAAQFLAAGLSVDVIEDTAKLCHFETHWALTTIEIQKAATDGAAPPMRTIRSAWPYGFSPRAQGEGCLALTSNGGCGAVATVWLNEKSTRVPAPRAGEELAADPGCVLVDGRCTRDGAYPVVGHLEARRTATFPVFGIDRQDGERLRADLATGLHVHVRYELEATTLIAPPKTVIARLPARAGAAPGYVLFCAHGDSDAGGPGADDNASGEATVLEIAAAWSAAVKAGLAPAPPREVRFAIWGSEIHSTRDFLRAREGGADVPLAVINFDQAGFGSGADQLNVEPDDVPANVALVRAAASVLFEHSATPGFPARWATNKSLGGTDSYVFSDSKAFRDGARPAVTLFTSAWGTPEEHPKTANMPGESWSTRDRVGVDFDNYYHSAGDTPENTTDLEPWNMGWCARVGLLSAHRWMETLAP